MSDNIYGVTLKVWDEMSPYVSKIKQSFGGLAGKIKRNTEAANNLKKSYAAFDVLNKKIAKKAQLEKRLGEQQKAFDALAKEISQTENPTKRLIQRTKTAEKRLAQLTNQFNHQRDAVRDHKREMKSSGINIRNLASEEKRLGKEIKQTSDKLRVQKGLLSARKTAWNVGKGAANKAWGAGKFAAKTGMTAGAAGIGIIANFNQTAAEFERYQTILETLEGSKQKAEKSFSWIKDFTAKTPYELAQVTDAFVKLRAYGLDPIEGDMLKTLGDTAAAMGKDIDQAVEAIADAVTGENERLKEFGIKASTKKNTITYSYTDSNGKQQEKKVDKNNRKMIQSTLQAIWNEKYAGNMDKMSKTWEGMWSNLLDHVSNFKQLVMSKGAFDFLKGKLSFVLTEIDRMTQNGELDAWATKISDNFVKFAKGVWETGKAIGAVVTGLATAATSVASFLGGWDNLLIGVAAFKALGLAASIAAIANPIGLAVAGATALGAVGYMIYNNWGRLMAWFDEKLPGFTGLVKTAFDISPFGFFINMASQLKAAWESPFSWFAEKFEWLGGIIKQVMQWKDQANAFASSINPANIGKAFGEKLFGSKPELKQPDRTIPSIKAEQQEIKTSGLVELKIDSPNAPVQVKRVRSENMDMSVDTGMVGLNP